MKKYISRLSSSFAFYFIAIFCLVSGSIFAQIVTNGGFENSDTGVVQAADVQGWLIQVGDAINPKPVFEIVGDTVQQGNRVLKVSINGATTTQWDIQAVADSLPVEQGTTYYYSVWAKAQKSGAQVNFTVGYYSTGEIQAIRPATLTTQWKKFTMQFTVNDNQSYIRAPIHFSYTANTNNVVYIDNLQIIDENFGKTPVIAEAESGTVGSGFSVLQSDDITFVTANTNHEGLTSPGDSSRVITYNVTFQDSGYYNLFARLRVGSGTFNDDSFFYAKGFGEKNDTASTDWVFINGLANVGFSDSAHVVDGMGTAGSQIWKWVNLTNNSYSGSPVDSFYVSLDSLTKTFQIGSREDGLDIDKLAFGKSNLYFTVNALDNELPGSLTPEIPDSSNFYQGPQLAEGLPKFLGNVKDIYDNNFANYWNQLTPGNEGKWGSVANTSDTSTWNWSALNALYNYSREHNLIYKHHTLIWGAQQPSWISGLDSTAQYNYIETWIRMVGERYPEIDMVDVVNEPLAGHNPPDGLNGRANYKKALGGSGATGWDWVIKSFELARQYLPDAELLLNDYGIINDNSSTYLYLQIINLLKDRNLIDGIGVQGHRFEFESASTTTLKYNLDRLAATGLPVYISEMDLGNYNDSGTPHDATQLQLYQKIFPVLWQHPGVQGITLWGYIEGQMWQPTCYLVHTDGTWRPALDWLAQYIKENPTGTEEVVNTIPSEFKLEQNFPNPFNPTTNISYSVAAPIMVTLKVYDVLGREIKTLVNNLQSPGNYTITFDARGLSSGVYFYRLSAGDFNVSKKLMLLK